MSLTSPKMIRRMYHGLFAVMGGVFVVGASVAYADILVTRSGESLTGDLSRVANGVVVFRTSLRGQMMLPASEVRSLQTDDRWIIRLAREEVHIGKFAAAAIALDGDASGNERRVSLDYAVLESAQKAPPLPAPKEIEEVASSHLNQEMGTGVQGRFGNQDTVAPFADWRLTYTGETQKLQLRLRTDIPDDAEEIGEFVRAQVALIPAVPRNWAPFVQLDVDRDTRQRLEWRTGLAVGLRYEFSTEPDRSLYTLLGVGGYVSSWRGYERQAWVRYPARSESGNLGAHLGVGHSQPVWRGGRWDTQLTLGPGSTSESDLRAQMETALSYPLTPRLQLRFDMLVAYEESPVFETLGPFDTSLGASVKFEF